MLEGVEVRGAGWYGGRGREMVGEERIVCPMKGNGHASVSFPSSSRFYGHAAGFGVHMQGSASSQVAAALMMSPLSLPISSCPCPCLVTTAECPVCCPLVLPSTCSTAVHL